jgi:hypothetical protein
LDAAAAEVEKALGRTGLAAEQRQALLQLVLEIHRARGDTVKAGRALEQLLAAGGAAATDPGAQAALADLRLSEAQLALDAGDLVKAKAVVEQNQANFVEPKQQAEALFLLARVAEASARKGTPVDAGQLRDAGLAYMRVVAHFKGVNGAEARVPGSLLRTAVILEDMGEKLEAARIYRELSESGDATIRQAAREGLERTKAKN